MKIAICLSGMLRNFEITYPRFKKFIIDKHSPDIFFCGYPNKFGFDYCNDSINNLYKPKKYILNEYTDELRKKICINENKYLSNKRNETTINNFISQLYNIKLCDDLRTKYESENNFKYDVVIRSRMDVFYFNSFEESELSQAKNGSILIPEEWDFKIVNDCAVSDSFAMSNSKNMEIYSSLYEQFDKYFDNGILFHPETLFGHHIAVNKLQRIKVAGHGWYKFENLENGIADERKKY